jgi:hypothetical protein
VNLVSAASKTTISETCITMLIDGATSVPEDLSNLANPFIFPSQADQLYQDLDLTAPLPVTTGGQAFDWLPDLADKNVGMPAKMNSFQVRADTLHTHAF